MAVYYKFKSAKDFDSIPIDGHFISVANLKERIFEAKHLGRGTDFDLMVSNAQTDEEYVDEAMLIPKNTSVLIRRVPGRPRKPIVAEPEQPKVEEDKLVDVLQARSSMSVAESSAMKIHDESEWDEFGNDLYDIPEVLPVRASNPVVHILPPSKVDEESKIKALVDTTALDWQRQIQDNFGTGRGFGRGMGGRMMGGRGFGRGAGGLVRKTPPQGYICHRCNVSGHFIQHCPTNGDPNYDIKRVKQPTGIPKSMLMATPDGSYALPSGAVAVLKPNEAAFEKEIEGLPSTRVATDLPPELRCPLCKEVMKDAVLTSKCCFSSFCDRCIRDYIISKSMCICGATNILADDLLPNKTLRETINRILESTTSSAENGGSLFQVQDMESARPAQVKAPSPTQSATSREEHKAPPPKEKNEIKDAGDENEAKGTVMTTQSLENKTVKNVGPSEPTAESMGIKEPTSQESAPVHEEEVQEKLVSGEQGKKKKKKKARLPGSADMQWRAFAEMGAENFAGMPMAPSAYNPCFGGMHWGMDGYMAPFPGAMPLMGYAPTPFDAHFGGMLPQDPFAAQGFMMPVLPQGDLSELSMGGINPTAFQPGMSREEMEARKAELWRKRAVERRGERDYYSRDKEMRRGAGGAEISALKPKPRPLASQAPGGGRGDRGKTARGPSLDPGDRGKAARAPSVDRPDKTKRSSSRAGSVDRALDRTRGGSEYVGPARDPPRPSPPRMSRRKPDHPDDAPPPAPPAARSAAERRQKGSVFSRISFPGSGGGGADGSSGSKKRKTPDGAPLNGFKDHESAPRRAASSSAGYEDERRAGKGSSSVVGARRGGALEEYDSDEEDHHFKRRPSSSRQEAGEREDGRTSRGSRERDRARGHEQHASKRR